MRYILPCLAIDEEELGNVQTKVVKSMLQKLGYPSTLPSEIQYGPVELGGLGLIDLCTKLGISTLTYMRHAIYSNTEAGKLMIMNVKYSQIESGILEPILEHPGGFHLVLNGNLDHVYRTIPVPTQHHHLLNRHDKDKTQGTK